MSNSTYKWKSKKLGEVISLQRGHDLTNSERIQGDVPVYGAAGHNGFHNKALVKGPGIVVGRSGGSFGQVHLVKKDFWPHNTAMYVTDFKGNDPFFIYYLLKLLDFDSLNSGSAQPSLNRNFLYPVSVNIPPNTCQIEIANVLSSLDSKIELNNNINAELEQMAKTIYDYWFVQFDFPISAEYAASVGQSELEGKPYKSSGGKMVWSEELKREVPYGWEIVELSDIANITMGQSPPGSSYNEESDGMIFFQGCTDFGNRFPSIRKFTKEPTRFAKIGDILLSVRAPVGTMNIANNNCCIGRGLAALNSKDNCISYLFGVMTNLKQIFDRRNTDGTTFGSITKDDLYSLKVVRPTKPILESYNQLMNPSFLLQNELEGENQKLTELRDWLLPMLINGQVRVSDVVDDDMMGIAAEPMGEYKVRGE